MLTQEWKYLLLIILIFIAACIETDIFLPALTDMMFYFSVSEAEIQSLLTLNFVGICVSGPIYGPLSDAIGRKKPLMIALSLFFVGSVLTMLPASFDFILLGRILQGLGSGGCFTLGTAVLFDTFQEKKATEALNKINTIVPFIMAAAPMLGGYLNYMYGFRSNFMAIGVFVLISFLSCLIFFKETLPLEKRVPLHPKKILGDFKKVALSLPFWQTTLVVSLIFAGYLAFLSGISILFVMEFDVTKEALPFFQAGLLGAWVLANFAYKSATKRWDTSKIKWIGTRLILLGGLGLIVPAFTHPENPYFFTLAMMFYAFGANWVQGLYFPEGMSIFPEIKGITASFLTSARLLIASLVVGVSSTLYNGTIYPIVGVVSAVIFVTLAIIYFYERKKALIDSGLLDPT